MCQMQQGAWNDRSDAAEVQRRGEKRTSDGREDGDGESKQKRWEEGVKRKEGMKKKGRWVGRKERDERQEHK